MMDIKRSKRKIAAVALASFALLFNTAYVPQAQAAEGEQNFAIENLRVHGQPRNESVRMSFDWKFTPTDRAPQPGEGFTLKLPQQLEFFGDSQGTRDWTYENVNVGSCLFKVAAVTCTFNDNISQFNHKRDLKGSAEARVSTRGGDDNHGAYTETTIPFKLQSLPNGPETEVIGAIPTGIAEYVRPPYVRTNFTKNSTPIGERNTSIPWSVAFNPSKIADDYPGVYPAPDGKTVISYTFNDSLGDGYNTDNLGTWQLLYTNDDTTPNPQSRRLADSNGLSNEGFSMQVTGTGTHRTIVVSGPFAAETNYRMGTPTAIANNGVAKPGVKYTNSISLKGTGAFSEGSRHYFITSRVVIEMKDGYGSLRLLKFIDGTASANIDSQTKFPIKLTYTLPDNKTPKDFPDWSSGQTPELHLDPEIAPDQNSGTLTIPVAAGSWTNYKYLFPLGTQIQISEDPAQYPKVAGVVFNADTAKYPSFASKLASAENFSAETPNALTVQIEDQQTTEVRITNSAEREKYAFKVKKTVTPPPGESGFAGLPNSVTMTYQCGSAKGTVQVPVTGAEVEVGKFQAGTVCEIVKEEGADFGDYTATADFGNAAVIAAGEPNLAIVNNAYKRVTSTFTVQKTLSGQVPAAANTKTFQFEAVCMLGGLQVLNQEISVVGAATSDPVEVPVGANCTVTEKLESLAEPNYDAQATYQNQNFNVEKDVVAAVVVNNEYTQHTGTFKVTKTLQGAPAAGAPATVDLSYTCGDVSGTKTVATDGSEVEIGTFPVGVECAVTAESGHEIDNYGVVQDFGTAVTIEKDKAAVVNVVNTYSQHTGAFKIRKEVIAAPGTVGFTAPENVELNYECAVPGQPAKTGTVTVPVNGEVQVPGQFPVGAVCKVTGENAQSAAVEHFSYNTQIGEQVTIAKDETKLLTVTNTYTRNQAEMKIVKALGANAPQAATAMEYRFGVECVIGAEKVFEKSGITIIGAQTSENIVVPAGATCAVTEDEAAAQLPDYDLAAVVQGNNFVADSQKASTVTVTNTYTKHTGTLKIRKDVVAPQGDVGFVAPANVTVSYVCVDGQEVLKSDTVTVPVNGTATVDGTFPVGTVCKVTAEDAASAAVAHFNVATELGAVSIAKGENTVAVTNTYTRGTGEFTIQKVLPAAPAVAATKEYTFSAVCELGGDKVVERNDIVVTGAATSAAVQAPAGAVCKVTEQTDALAPITNFVLAEPQYENNNVTIQNGAVANIIVTNTYKRAQGQFSVQKLVEGDPMGAADKQYSFAAVCELDGQKVLDKQDITVVAGQTTEPITVPAGAACEVTEQPASAAIAGYDVTVSYQNNKFEVAQGQPVTVTATNAYTPWLANFEVVKELSGSAKTLPALQQQEFEVAYQCELGSYKKSGTVRVSAGKPALVEQVQSAAECVFTENTDFKAPAGAEFNRKNSTLSVTAVAGADKTVTEVKLVNEFNTPAVEVPVKPGNTGLAATGSNGTTAVLVGAGVLVAAGAAVGIVMLLKRRRQQ